MVSNFCCINPFFDRISDHYTVSDVGNCVILPVPSSRRKDSNEDLFAKNSRCDACLLSLCLQKYIMPTSTKKSLFQLIPEDVKSHYLNELSPDFKKSLPALGTLSISRS